MKKKLSKGIITSLNFGIFPGKVLLCCDYTYQEVHDQLEKQKLPEWLGAFMTCKETIDGGCWCAFKREYKDKLYFFLFIPERFNFADPDHYCKLAHEVLHVVQFNLRDILDRDREFESEAYLHTHLMRQCIEALKPKK